MHQALVDSVRAVMVLTPALVNNNTRLSKFVDTRDHAFVEFHLMVGATAATVNAKVQESVNADGSAASDVEGASVTQIGATGDDRMVVVSVAKSALTKRYAGVLVTISNEAPGANTAIEAFQWGKSGTIPEDLPVAGANVYGTEEVVRVS